MLKHPDYPNGNIYLSGGMQPAPDDLGADWRRECSKHLREMGFFPLDIAELDLAYRDAHGHLFRFMEDDEILQRKSNIRKHFIETDIALIRNDTDAIIILYCKRCVELVKTTFESHKDRYQFFLEYLEGTEQQITARQTNVRI